MRRGAILIAAAALAGCASMPGDRAPLLAVTVDDLPVHGEMPPGDTPVEVARRVSAALRNEGVDAYGFINGERTQSDPGTLEVLTTWRAAGLPLANHGWAHRHLSEMSVEEFEREVARNEPLLKQLSRGDEWRWFRYPFVDEGETPAKRAAARAVLARRGYKVAAATMDFGDWQWTAPYVRCKTAGDQAALAWLEQSFLHSAHEGIGFYQSLSRKLHGRDIPYVLVLHVSAFEGRMLPRLLGLYRQHGFRFVGLGEAQRDAAYADQVDPSLPAEPQGLEGKARARGIPLPPRTEYAARLEAICR